LEGASKYSEHLTIKELRVLTAEVPQLTMPGVYNISDLGAGTRLPDIYECP
jgi:hypothetical protein